jgi:hypothetical protein
MQLDAHSLDKEKSIVYNTGENKKKNYVQN